MSKKELIISYDTPSFKYSHLMEIHNLEYYLMYFDRLHVVYWSKDKDKDKPFDVSGGKIRFYPYKGEYSSSYVVGLAYMWWVFSTLNNIRAAKPKDTEYVHMAIMPLWPGLPALVAAKLRRDKIVLRLEAHKTDYVEAEDRSRGVHPLVTNLKIFTLNFFYSVTVPFFDYVIGISRDIIEQAKRFRAKRTVLIPMPIDIDNFKPRKAEENSEISIISVAQIKERKGFGEIIEALQMLKKETGSAPKLRIAGEVTNPEDAKHLEKFKEMAEGLDVEFLGRIPHKELAKEYNRADIFILASYVETLGMVTMEAMASGLPVIATNTPGSRDLVDDGVNGFLVDVKSARQIKEKLELLLNDEGLRLKLGKQARGKMEDLMHIVDENNKKLWDFIFRK